MDAKNVVIAIVAVFFGVLGPIAALIAGTQAAHGAAMVAVAFVIVAALLGSVGVVLCRDDEQDGELSL